MKRVLGIAITIASGYFIGQSLGINHASIVSGLCVKT